MGVFIVKALIILSIVVIGTLLIGVIVFATVSNFLADGYAKYKNKLYPNSFEELMQIFNVIVSTEISEYRREIFSKHPVINQSQYENYYKDLTNKIISNISEEFITQMTKYMTREAVYKYIARAVKAELNDNIRTESAL